MFHRPKLDMEDTDTAVAVKPADTAVVTQARNAETAPKAPPANYKEPSAYYKDTSKLEEKPMSKEDKPATSRPLDIPGQATTSYQPPRIPGSYNVGAFPGVGQPSNTSSSAPAAGQGRRLLIGQGITLSGEIEACDYLVVEGTVEAALKGASVLEISETGTFYGTVEIDEATVAGKFEGDITVNGRLSITATGSITGTIAYKELAIEAGATLDGKVSPLTNAVKADKQPKEARGKSDAARNDNKGAELPFASAPVAAAAE